jgi:hypothetical protein
VIEFHLYDCGAAAARRYQYLAHQIAVSPSTTASSSSQQLTVALTADEQREYTCTAVLFVISMCDYASLTHVEQQLTRLYGDTKNSDASSASASSSSLPPCAVAIIATNIDRWSDLQITQAELRAFEQRVQSAYSNPHLRVFQLSNVDASYNCDVDISLLNVDDDNDAGDLVKRQQQQQQQSKQEEKHIVDLIFTHLSQQLSLG